MQTRGILAYGILSLVFLLSLGIMYANYYHHKEKLGEFTSHISCNAHVNRNVSVNNVDKTLLEGSLQPILHAPGGQGLWSNGDSQLFVARSKYHETIQIVSPDRSVATFSIGNINAADVSGLSRPIDNNHFLAVSNYDKNNFYLLGKKSLEEIPLDSSMGANVGLTNLGGYIVIIRRDSKLLSIFDPDEKELFTIPLISNQEGAYDIVGKDRCIFTVHRESGIVSTIKNDTGKLVTNEILSDLSYPQSGAFSNRNFCVIESGIHSITCINLVTSELTQIKLPNGVYRGLSINPKGVYVSGQILKESDKSTVSVSDENEVYIYKVVSQFIP